MEKSKILGGVALCSLAVVYATAYTVNYLQMYLPIFLIALGVSIAFTLLAITLVWLDEA